MGYGDGLWWGGVGVEGRVGWGGVFIEFISADNGSVIADAGSTCLNRSWTSWMGAGTGGLMTTSRPGVRDARAARVPFTCSSVGYRPWRDRATGRPPCSGGFTLQQITFITCLVALIVSAGGMAQLSLSFTHTHTHTE